MEKEHAIGADGARFLTFDIAGEEYSIPIDGISEIVECGRMVEVEGVEYPSRGVLCRGAEVIPVVDLAMVRGLPATPLTRWTCIVVIDVQDGPRRFAMGMLVNIQSCRITSAEGITEMVAGEPPPDSGEWPAGLRWGKPVRGLG